MSTQTKNKVVLFGMIVGMILLTALLIVQNASNANASVEYAGAAYMSTTTKSSIGVDMVTNQPLTPLTASSGILGSVIITGANTGVMTIYDATTTGSHSDYPTEVLATFPASVAAGTYTFDVEYHHGLVVEISGSPATSTITWKR